MPAGVPGARPPHAAGLSHAVAAASAVPCRRLYVAAAPGASARACPPSIACVRPASVSSRGHTIRTGRPQYAPSPHRLAHWPGSRLSFGPSAYEV